MIYLKERLKEETGYDQLKNWEKLTDNSLITNPQTEKKALEWACKYSFSLIIVGKNVFTCDLYFSCIPTFSKVKKIVILA